jgi:dihydrofolate reductase
VWPKRKDSPFTPILENAQKYVASRTLKDPLPWANSKLLKGEAARTVKALKEESDKNLLVLGSGELAQSLIRGGVVDEYVLFIHPLVLGTGRRLFPDGGAYAGLRLHRSKMTSNGVVIATYRSPDVAVAEIDQYDD